jgi:hypothetical protein
MIIQLGYLCFLWDYLLGVDPFGAGILADAPSWGNLDIRHVTNK